MQGFVSLLQMWILIYQEQFEIDSFWICKDIASQGAGEWARWTSKQPYREEALGVGNSIPALASTVWEWG